MTSRDDIANNITAHVLLKAYSCGIFPMAESADDSALYWIEPDHRGIVPLDAVHIPRKLAKTIRAGDFRICVDHDYDGVLDGCAAVRPGRASTWINKRIRELYRELYRDGFCHTVEVWQHEKLVGGLYGVALGGVFFGESMFSTVSDTSKIALVYLVARLIEGNFKLLDTQFVTEHLRQFGTIEIDRDEFHRRLEAALPVETDFHALADDVAPQTILDIIAGCGGVCGGGAAAPQ